MLLVTKEIFIKLKELISLNVTLHKSEVLATNGKFKTVEQWQIAIYGIINVNNVNDVYQTYVTCESKEEAYRIYDNLLRQLIDSGEIPEFQAKLLDKLLDKNPE